MLTLKMAVGRPENSAGTLWHPAPGRPRPAAPVQSPPPGSGTHGPPGPGRRQGGGLMSPVWHLISGGVLVFS